MDRRRNALIVSPVPSDPIDQGNSARISRLCELLRYGGYRIHFVYYGMEGLTPDQRLRMEQRWDMFDHVRPLVAKRQTGVDGFDIDDYCGAELPDFVAALQRRGRYDLAIINYVWMSRVADVIDPRTFCAIDTHDLFGDRHHKLQGEGVAPTWFFCSAAEERRGLDRADAVIAIQDEEAEMLAGRTSRPVHVVGHILPPTFLATAKDRPGRIRVGYIASDNPSNRRTLEALIEAAAAHPDVAERFEFVIAGRIGIRVPPGTAGFRPVGIVRDAGDFYRTVDMIVNANISGTGLKIKTVEALSYGLPLLATADAMCGIESDDAGHACRDVPALIAQLRTIRSRDALEPLRNASRTVFRRYTDTQRAGLQALLRAADDHGRVAA